MHLSGIKVLEIILEDMFDWQQGKEKSSYIVNIDKECIGAYQHRDYLWINILINFDDKDDGMHILYTNESTFMIYNIKVGLCKWAFFLYFCINL